VDSRADRPPGIDREEGRVRMATAVAALVSSGAPPLDELFDAVAEIICRDMADVRVLGVLSEHDSMIHPVGLYHRDARPRGMLNTASELAWEPVGGVSEQVLGSGATALLGYADLEYLTRHPRLAGLVGEDPLHSALVVPMRTVGKPVGLMAMGRTTDALPYSEEDFTVVQLVADRLGLAISVLHVQEALDRVGAAGEVAASADGRLAGLTDREREIFRLIVEGLTSREIGEKVFLSVRTVEWHRARLMGKMHVSTRSELIALGRTLRP
jgi:DNA-binding CsgD family transcriptional regulator